MVKSGLRDWLIQRGSAIVVTSYFIFLILFLLSNSPLEYVKWKSLFSSPGMQIFSTLFFISLCWHSWIGLWTVVTDYIKPPILRLTALTLILCAIASTLVWGISLVWRG